MSKYTGIDSDWDKIYRLLSEATNLLVSKGSTQAEIFLIASIMAAISKANLENTIAIDDWNAKERSSFWNDIKTELQKHETLVRETMNERRAKISGSIEDSLGEQLNDKRIELNVIAARCGLDEKDICSDIADSMEEATNLTKPLDSPEISDSWWGLWWYKLLERWAGKCFIKYMDKSRELYPHILYSNYEEMRGLWLSEFEPLWEVGCDVARLIEIDLMMKSVNKFISSNTGRFDENQKQSIRKWVNSYDEIALGLSDLFRKKLHKVFDSSLEWSKGHSKDLISAELKRLLSN